MTKDFRLTSLLKKVKNIKLYELSGRTGQDLLGHESGRITTHYSAAELHNLLEAADKVSGENSRKSPAMTILNRKTG